MKKILQMEPWFDEAEAEAVYAYMKSGGWVTEFRKCRELEQMLAEFTGSKHCSLMPNGTLSLSCALLACGVRAGDEVLVPDFTMVATANAAELIGARAIFVDVEGDTACMDFDALQRACTERTTAVLLVLVNGRHPSRLEEIVSFCAERDLALIEDAAQALGSRFGDRHLGTMGRIGSFSFSAPKVITTGQGGALVTDDDELIRSIRRLRDFGRDGGGNDDYITMGWNLKFTDLQAVIGIEQMKKLPWRIERKKEIGQLYERLLSDVQQIRFFSTDYGETSPWFIDILVDDRDELQAYLAERGIGARPVYPALHSCGAYRREGSFPVAEEIARTGLWLPSASRLSDEDVELVCAAIRDHYAAGR